MDTLSNGKGRFLPVKGLILCNLFLFSLAILLNAWVIRRFQSCGSANSLRPDGQQPGNSASDYPLPSLVDYIPVEFEANLGAPSVFKGLPRKELNEAWNALVDQPMILVNEETLHSLDPTPERTKGKDGHYYATVEVFHQLHCLDITRKFIWRDHYQQVDAFQDSPEMVWEHVDHCIDLLRQVVMCNGDVGLIFYTDVGAQQPVARVSTSHMCRNFSKITEWVNRHDEELGTFAESRSG